jgi:type IV pilus assembly protein PilY1
MRMRRTHALVALGAIAAAAVVPRSARAQAVDENPPLPNVMILLDTSGSFERMIDGSLPEANANGGNNACQFGVQTTANRWGTTMQALTGDIQPYYSCVAESRASGAAGGTYSLMKEFQIAGKNPYDADYYLPFHRPVSYAAPMGSSTPSAPGGTGCVFSPNALPGASFGQGVGVNGIAATSPSYATDFPANGITQEQLKSSGSPAVYGVDSTSTTNSCTFSQLNDGALDSSASYIRYGLMTYDGDPAPGTGVTTGTNLLVTNTPSSPFNGMWSYFPGWDGNGAVAPVTGILPSCVPQSWELGARNAAAPPWEGRMVPFPAPTASAAAIATQNGQLQAVISAMRPYGATPTGALMSDAQYYFTLDPKGPLGSTPDTYVQGGCRSQYIILITDGAPNQDMRTNCEAAGGTCPSPKPWTTAATLAALPTPVYTFVIGFAVSTYNNAGVLANCSSLVTTGTLPTPGNTGTPATLSPQCSATPVPANLTACCNLEQIAVNGGTGAGAYFADTAEALNNAINSIIGGIGSNISTRTTPTYSPVVSTPATGQPLSSTFLASFTSAVGVPWEGDIQREQQQCSLSGSTFTVPTPTVTIANGDDFASNLNVHSGSIARSFFAVNPGTSSQTPKPLAFVRPFAPTSPLDGLPTYTGTTYGPAIASLIANIAPAALGIPTTTPSLSACGNIQGNQYLSTSNCEALGFNFLFAQQSTPGLQTNPPPPANPLPPDANGYPPFQSRYCTSGCNTKTPNVSAMGAILHASPVVDAAPASLDRDESYQAFVGNNVIANGGNARKTVVYSQTEDGILHAFWADITTNTNNELWAFVPPSVLPNIIPEYPSSNQTLLDGGLAVKDVVFSRQAVAGVSLNVVAAAADWHTMLVGSYGSQQRGFYGVDVTNPDPAYPMPSPNPYTTQANGGPGFRWQTASISQSTGTTSYEIFGAHSANPAITTIYADLTGANSTANAQEYGVAILPGGQDVAGPSSTTVSCARSGPLSGTATEVPLTNGNGQTFTPRANVRCWGANSLKTDAVVGRSLSIVRLETGEIIKTFARKVDFTPPAHPLLTSGRVIDTPFDSPMTGTPVVYPTETGSIAQKIFISDADGTVWKIDVTELDPGAWTAEMFFDTVNTTVDTTSTSWNNGQPIEVPPVTALDPQGNIVLGIATGDQETYTPVGNNYVYSITEKVQGTSTAALRSFVNWYYPLTNGERVSGPMSIFNGALFWATFRPATTQSCTNGSPWLYGMDYVTPFNTANLAQGGVAKFPTGPTTFAQSYDPSNGGSISGFTGVVIPGVSIQAQPACASTTSGADSYAYGATHTTLSNVTAGAYSLQYTAKLKTANGQQAVNTGSTALAAPSTPTFINSWAGVVE